MMARSTLSLSLMALSLLLFLCYLSSSALSASVITHLPGFQGPLPFYLETGYVSVDEVNVVELFYYFIKSERNPSEDPLVLWLSGGPGCSAFYGLVFQVGPLRFVTAEYNGSLPNLVYHPYSWTKAANIIFLDSPVGAGFSFSRKSEGYLVGDISSSMQVYKFLRKSYAYFLSYYWANSNVTRKALHIKKGTVREWQRCNRDLPYTKELPNNINYHLSLTSRGYRALVYSGDHDFVVPFLGTQAWVRSLGFSVVDEWRSWRVRGEIAGYTTTYSNNLTFATVKGAGHTAPEYKPKECLPMFERWISYKPL